MAKVVQTAFSSASSGDVAIDEVSSALVGHCYWCTDPVCHQFHTSSVAKGSNGANNRCKVDSARRNAIRAESEPSGESSE